MKEKIKFIFAILFLALTVTIIPSGGVYGKPGDDKPKPPAKPRETAEVQFFVKLDGTDANNDPNVGYSQDLYTVSIFSGHVYTDTKAYKDDKLTLADVFDYDDIIAVENLKKVLSDYTNILYTSNGDKATEADIDSIGINWYVFKSKSVNNNPLHVDGQMTGLVVVPPTNTPIPTEEPTPIPTEEPTPIPTDTPTPEPTEEPINTPTPIPTNIPTAIPTDIPTETPTPIPTEVPTNTPKPTVTTEPLWNVFVVLDNVELGSTPTRDFNIDYTIDWFTEMWINEWNNHGIDVRYVDTAIDTVNKNIFVYYETVKDIEPTPTVTPVIEPTNTPMPTPTLPPVRDVVPKTGDTKTIVILGAFGFVMLAALGFSIYFGNKH